MQETNVNYIPMLIYELLLECLLNFVEKYMKQLVFRSIWPNFYFFQKTVWHLGNETPTEMAKTVQ